MEAQTLYDYAVLILWHTLDFGLIVPRVIQRQPLTLDTFLV